MLMAESSFWSVPRLWNGATIVCLGGGPSLTQAQVDTCRGRARVIAINDSYLLAPWAEVLYFCDRRWFEWHEPQAEFRAFKGIKVTLDEQVLKAHPEIRGVKNTGRDGLETDPTGVRTGRNSGYQAINLAVHLGARRIVLLGYDMKPAADGRTHWHGGHPVTLHETVFAHSMLPCFPSLVEPLRQRRVAVLNATPGSALTVFPMLALEQALQKSEVRWDRRVSTDWNADDPNHSRSYHLLTSDF
ncbi:MAG: hypothetical protein IIA44_04000 [Acidobacteria bacterium]|nr:hypothetical protein [Acidobacteriota bacterium]